MISEKCSLCKVNIASLKVIKADSPALTKLRHIHHISYFPERTINVCSKCHSKIHHTEDLRELKPLITESHKFYKREETFKLYYDRFYTHLICGSEMLMDRTRVALMLKYPGYFLKVFCDKCGDRFPLEDFVWSGTDTKLGDGTFSYREIDDDTLFYRNSSHCHSF